MLSSSLDGVWDGDSVDSGEGGSSATMVIVSTVKVCQIIPKRSILMRAPTLNTKCWFTKGISLADEVGEMDHAKKTAKPAGPMAPAKH